MDLTELFIHNCGYHSFLITVSMEDIIICFNEIQQIHCKIIQCWYNPRTFALGSLVKRILDRGLQVFPKLCTLEVHDLIKFYDKFQELSTVYLIPLVPFNAVHLESNY
jgi:hypothetical protein